MNDDTLVLDNPELTAQRLNELLGKVRKWRDIRKSEVDTLIRSLAEISRRQLGKHLDGTGANLATWQMKVIANELYEAQEELNRMLRKEHEYLYLLGL